MNDHMLEQLVHFPTREGNTIMSSLPAQFVEIHSPDRLGYHDIVSGTLNVVIPPPPIRNLGGRPIVIRKVIMNLSEENHLNLQRKGTSMVTLMLAKFKKTSS